MGYRNVSRQAIGQESPRTSALRVLVVEDSRTFALALRRMIEAETGRAVTVCTSLKELRATILQDQEGFEVAVVDLNLPDAPDGEALDWTISHGIPSIVFTGRYDEASRARIMERDVFDYVLKENEFSLPNLVGSVQRALTNPAIGVLVVDDMASTRRLLARMLTCQRYAVREAGSGAEAIDILESDPKIRIVLSDYHMPDMNGFELARQIRRRHPVERVRIIGISSSTDKTTSAAFLKAGAHDFVSRPFVPEEMQCRVASNVETLQRIRQLHDLAWRDTLTGLSNRRHFFEEAPRAIERQRARSGASVVAIVDVDHFKAINDSHGHAAGDSVLRDVAGVIAGRLGEGEHLLSRIGGEEFALVLPGETLETMTAAIEDLRRHVDGARFHVCGEPVVVTLSVGMTLVQPLDGLDDALKRADEALYNAKKEGRNRVSCLA